MFEQCRGSSMLLWGCEWVLEMEFLVLGRETDILEDSDDYEQVYNSVKIG